MNALFDEISEVIGSAATDKLFAHYGGQQIYIPMRRDNSKRDAEIKKKFTGDNVKPLAREYGLSEVQIRTIAAKPLA